MQKLNIALLEPRAEEATNVEIVERKGIGHPDTMCDALADELSRSLSQFYLENFGLVLHHNVDKALLWGGSSLPAFKGGEILAPMEIFLAGRATCEYKGITVPLDDLVMDSCTSWLHSHFHHLDPEKHVRIHHLIRPGSSDLVELYLRQEETGIALANDTSCGVGYAPLSNLEKIVLRVEKYLNSNEIKSTHPEIGEDIKVMGMQRDNTIELTIACAFIDRYITDIDDYMHKKIQLMTLVESMLEEASRLPVSITINAADNPDTQSLYMTVTGTSAESGDDGEVGRGNRVNGLITPYRPMNMEAAAGKNPVTHVGKLYNILAQQIADNLVKELSEVSEVYCYMLSQIGSPITEPKIIDLKIRMHDGLPINTISSRVEEIVNETFSSIYLTRQQLIDGSITVY